MKCKKRHRRPHRWPDHLYARDDFRYPPRHYHKPYTETILRCGNSVGSIPLGINSVWGVRESSSIASDSYGTVVASISLNLSELISPTIKIDFSSLVSFRTIGDDNYSLRLLFKLSRVCGGYPIALGTWTFEQSHVVNEDMNNQINGEYVQETDPFSFSWCARDVCHDCCRYVIEVAEWSYNIDFATISNVSMSALAAGTKYFFY